MNRLIRQPAVCGSFYPRDRLELIDKVDKYLAEAEKSAASSSAVAVICPHAGYIYSGFVTGAVLGRVEVPQRVILVGPKHRRAGAAVAVDTSDAWRFPFGDVAVDTALSDAVAKRARAELDAVAHRDEHSLEVQVPFLWRRRQDIRIVALALGHEAASRLEEIGTALADVVQAEATGGGILLLASTDMSHYLSHEVASTLDALALAHIDDLDPPGLLQTVVSKDISMCGVLPTVAVLYAAKILGAREAVRVRYATSGQTSGDYSAVVGYAGYVIL